MRKKRAPDAHEPLDERDIDLAFEKFQHEISRDKAAKNDEMLAYMAKLRFYPVIKDAEPFNRLFTEYKHGSTELAKTRARDRLIYGNIRLVIAVARKYHFGLPLVDLIQEGVIGMMRALESFEPEKGYRFSTYAQHWIRQSVGRAIADKSRLIRLPVHISEKVYSINRSLRRLAEKLEREPTPGELFADLQVQENKNAASIRLREIPKLLRLARMHFTSFDQVLGHADGHDLTLEEVIPSPTAHPEEQLVVCQARQDLLEALRQVNLAIDELSERQATVLRLRFGLDGGEPMILEDLAQRFGLTRERIRQIEANALGLLTKRYGIDGQRLERLLEAVEETERLTDV